MANILKKYRKTGVIITGSDNVELDTPTFEIVRVNIDTVNSLLSVEVMHEVNQGSLVRKHSRTFEVPFSALTATIKNNGKKFLDAIESEILKLPQYNGATEL